MTLSEYIKTNRDSFKQHYKMNPLLERFKEPDDMDSSVQERIQRLGIEARLFNIKTLDELTELAKLTLHQDHIKYHVNNP